MNIFDGLDKFGLDLDSMDNLFSDGKAKEKVEEAPVPVVQQDKEEDFLMNKEVTCTVCDRKFTIRALKTSKLRRMEPDKDLRPRYQSIDSLKYDVISCPYCGYSGMTKYFDHLSSLQIRLIKEGVCSKFHPTTKDVPVTYDYDMALEKYKLSLYNTVAKKGKNSEKAYTCLKMSWLCRGQIEELLEKGAIEQSETIQKWRKMERAYYEQAFEGMTKAVASEDFPICGMDQNTMDLLLAQMGTKLERYDVASKLVARLLTSKTANRNVKDRALDLKEEILAQVKK